ncbi:AAA domain-containing protein [Cunninghamella echinulata]|nr:AAA domain-containing protein [Cunninghamella echinulata]
MYIILCLNIRSIPLVLFFPTLEKAMTAIKTRKLPKRTKTIPTKFKSVTEYKEIFKKAIHEHLQLMLLNNAMHYFINSEKATTNNMERFFRSKGLSFYTGCRLKSNSYYIHEDVFNLSIQNRENHNKYSKDDIWVISTSLSFDSSQTFLGRSTFYGPSSDGCIEFKCITPRDYRVASKFPTNQPSLFALRTISAGSEFMMLDTLEDTLDQLPVLPNILNDGKRSKRNNQPELHNIPMNETNQLAVIRLTEGDCINISEKLDETTRQYKLNEDQASALYFMAKSVIIAPGWNEDANNPITLVHGVFGSGKRSDFLQNNDNLLYGNFIFLKKNKKNTIKYKITINIIIKLKVLVKLGFDNFVRVGSLKRIAKNLLPYTVRAKITGNEELKELEHMLDDPNNTEEEIENISSAIQRFRKCENILEVHKADVVGTTCNASSFDIFNDTVFPFILMDECSQLMEPMTIVPLARFKCSRIVLIGDPLQLPPTIATQSDDDRIGQGLDKTLFSRLIECHPSISSISNKLFYENKLLNGHVVENRRPLVTGLSPLIFVDVIGNDQKSIGNSFWNRDEIAIVAHTIQELSNLGVDSSSIGIISLYKEQVDKIQLYLGNNVSNQNNISNIQISTVDAFQGAEKEIIILSTVRTSGSGFIDQLTRVNVALTRARRHLIILGNKNLLSGNETWSKILMECQGNKI